MFYQKKLIVLLCLICVGTFANDKKAGVPTELLPIERLKALKNQPCAFFHVWATWCQPCIAELPKLLKLLADTKNVQPVVIDVSKPFTQKQFSIKWVEGSLKPPFATFRKPEGKDEPYLEAIDKKWSGSMPYSLVYRSGKKVREWRGVLDLKTFPSELAKACK